MSKRKQPSSDRVHKKKIFKRLKVGQSPADLSSGIMGLFVTHDPGKAGSCVADVRDWIKTWVDRIFPEPESGAEANGEDQSAEKKDAREEDVAEAVAHRPSVSSALEEELRQLRGEAAPKDSIAEAADGPPQRMIREVPNVSRTAHAICLHLSNHSDTNIAEVVWRMLSAVQEGSEPVRARHALKLTPFQSTCFSDPEVLMKTAAPVIERVFAEEPPGTTWGIVFEKSQDNGRMNRDECIRNLTSLVPRHCSVDLKDPKWTIVVKVLGRVTGFGVLREYRKLARYNVRELRRQVMDREDLEGQQQAEESAEDEDEEQQEAAAGVASVEPAADEAAQP